MQKPCSGLLLNAQGRLLAAGCDGCCYVLDAESLQQDSRLILHPSQTGKPLLLGFGIIVLIIILRSYFSAIF